MMTDAERAAAKATMREHGIVKMVTHDRTCAMVRRACTCGRHDIVIGNARLAGHANDCAKSRPADCTCTPDVIVADDA